MTKKEQRIAVYNKYNAHCAYCGKVIKFKEMEVDNRDVDTFDNLMPACKPCNRAKKYHSLELWRELLEGKINELNRDSAVYRTAKRFGLVKETGVKVIFYFEKQEIKTGNKWIAGQPCNAR